MIFRDKNIHDIIEKLSNHYNIFTNNEFMKYYLLDSKIQKNVWIDIEDLIYSNKNYEAVGYDLEKLYEQIWSFTSFLLIIKKETLSRITSEALHRMDKMTTENRILFKMTLDNTPGNLKLFYDLIAELFINVKNLDKTMNGEEKALYNKFPNTKELEERLNITNRDT